MKSTLLKSIPLALLILFLGAAPSWAESPAGHLENFIHYSKDPGALETSIIRFENSKGQTLDLISAVHIGTTGYYKTLNETFQNYDALLYELVIPKSMVGKQLPTEMGSDSGVSGFQGTLANSMGLVSQVEQIDYSPANFVHADMTLEGLQEKMAEKNENLLSYLMTAMGGSDAMTESTLGLTEEELNQIDFMAVLNGEASTKDRRLLRKLFAAVLSSSGGVMAALSETAIVSERNIVAMEVLQREVEKGTQSMGLFYGAAHMPDLERRLIEAGWKKKETNWIRAWSI